MSAPRPICDIVVEIQAKWTKPYFGAEPYLQALRSIRSINEKYYADSARELVNYLLANMHTFRGPDARRLKAELKAHLDNEGPSELKRLLSW